MTRSTDTPVQAGANSRLTGPAVPTLRLAWPQPHSCSPETRRHESPWLGLAPPEGETVRPLVGQRQQRLVPELLAGQTGREGFKGSVGHPDAEVAACLSLVE